MKYSLLGACALACCCAAPIYAQGLSRVETLALQQQLRDDGCGSSHITGRVDAMTRANVKKCESKYAGATDPRSMLSAMKIGFGPGMTDPTMGNARSGEGGSMGLGGTSAGSMHNNSMNRRGNMSRGMSDSAARRGGRRMMRDSTMMRHGSGMRDSTAMHRGSGMRHSTMMRDSAHKSHGAAGMSRSGGMVDMHKQSPMAPNTKMRDTSTRSHDTSSMKRP